MQQEDIDHARLRRLETILSGLLRYGALFACTVLLAGMVLNASSPALIQTGQACLTGGIIFLIALPVLRVAIMAAIFLFERDYRFAAIAAAVLTIISLGFALGSLHTSTPAP
jgi:uncharacterized membrane protein